MSQAAMACGGKRHLAGSLSVEKEQSLGTRTVGVFMLEEGLAEAVEFTKRRRGNSGVE